MVEARVTSPRSTVHSPWMNGRVALWTVVCGLWTATLGLSGVATAHSGEATVSVKTYTPVVIDGKLEEWVRRVERSNWTGKLELQKGQVVPWIRAVAAHLNALVSKVEAGAVDSLEDFSAK